MFTPKSLLTKVFELIAHLAYIQYLSCFEGGEVLLLIFMMDVNTLHPQFPFLLIYHHQRFKRMFSNEMQSPK